MTMPDTLYITSPEWGETHILTKEALLDLIVGLRALGPDWASIRLDDCEELRLERPISSSRAVYQRPPVNTGYGRYRAGDHVTIHLSDGRYTEID